MSKEFITVVSRSRYEVLVRVSSIESYCDSVLRMASGDEIHLQFDQYSKLAKLLKSLGTEEQTND